jgi:hypothetical protein
MALVLCQDLPVGKVKPTGRYILLRSASFTSELTVNALHRAHLNFLQCDNRGGRSANPFRLGACLQGNSWQRPQISVPYRVTPTA